MTRDEMVAYIRGACDKMIETMEKKNADYTAADSNPFANFLAVEKLGICDAETGIMVRRVDKLMRTMSFVKKGVLQVTDETVEDTLRDDACYALLLAALIRSKRQKEISKAPAALERKVYEDSTGRQLLAIATLQAGLWTFKFPTHPESQDLIIGNFDLGMEAIRNVHPKAYAFPSSP